MIRLTRLNHGPFLVNPDLIEHVETAPDTVIALTTGQRLMVLESPEQVVERIIEFRRSLYARMCGCPNAEMAAHARPVQGGEGI